MVEKRYYKSVTDGYIDHVGFGYGAPEITVEEYQALRDKLLSIPEAPEGYEYRLREDGELELHEVKGVPEDALGE